MGILRTLFLVLISVSLFSQIAEKKEYHFPTYCWSGDGATNWIQTPLTLTGGDSISIYIEFEIFNVTGVKTFFEAGGYSGVIKGIFSGLYDNKIRVYISNGTILSSAQTTNTLTSGKHQMMLTWDGVANSDINIYFADTLFETLNINSTWVGSSLPLQIGSYATGAGYFNGKINEFKYWDDIATSKTHTSPLIYYPLCEGYNDTAYDVSVNGNNGVLYGSNYWTRCGEQTYPETNGVSKHYYKGHAVYVPYLLTGQPISTTAINAAETVINYSFTLWGKTYLVK